MKLGQRIAQNQIAKLKSERSGKNNLKIHGGIYYGSTAQFISNEL
jgi:hypothetical protein